MTNNGYGITMPARLGPQYAKAIFNIMIRHALDETGNNFLRLILGWVFHYFEQPGCQDQMLQHAVSATGTLLRISAVSTRSTARGHALVLLCRALAHLPVADEQSAGIEGSCLYVV